MKNLLSFLLVGLISTQIIYAQGYTQKELGRKPDVITIGYDLNQGSISGEFGVRPGFSLGVAYTKGGTVDGFDVVEDGQIYLVYGISLEQITDPASLYYHPLSIDLIAGASYTQWDTEENTGLGGSSIEESFGLYYGAGVSLRFEPITISFSYTKATGTELDYLTLKFGYTFNFRN